MTALDEIKDVLEENSIEYTIFICNECEKIDGKEVCVSIVPNDDGECPVPIYCLYGKPGRVEWGEVE
jgi:hypothetical protein